jgi:hypothetical protein
MAFLDKDPRISRFLHDGYLAEVDGGKPYRLM